MTPPEIELQRVDKHIWRFSCPQITNEIWEQAYAARDSINASHPNMQGLETLLKLRRDYPEFIEAHDYIALFHYESGQLDLAFKTWKTSVDIGLQALPANFYFGRDTLPWEELDNRAFLRAYYHLGLSYYEDQGLLGEALHIFQNILDLNPNDNQGIRFFASKILLQMHRPLDAIKICKRYKDYGDRIVIYAWVLALYQLGKKQEARQVLRSYGLTERPEHNSDHWEIYKDVWQQTEGALDFVKAELTP